MAKCELGTVACKGQDADVHVVRKDGKEIVICWLCWCHDQESARPMGGQQRAFSTAEANPDRTIPITNFDPGHSDPKL